MKTDIENGIAYRAIKDALAALENKEKPVIREALTLALRDICIAGLVRDVVEDEFKRRGLDD